MGSRGTRRSRLPCRTMVVPRTRSTCTGYALWRSRGPRRANVWFFSLQHTFSVVRSAGSEAYNYANPPRRDVVNTGVAGDNVTIRFTVRLLPSPAASLPCSSASTDGFDANPHVWVLVPIRLAHFRMYQQRVATAAIIVVLVLLILIILYFKLVR